MPALQPQPEIITMEQYEALPDDVRAEVFDGVLYNMDSPSELHQTVFTELTTILNNYIKSSIAFSVDISSKTNTAQQADGASSLHRSRAK